MPLNKGFLKREVFNIERFKPPRRAAALLEDIKPDLAVKTHSETLNRFVFVNFLETINSRITESREHSSPEECLNMLELLSKKCWGFDPYNSRNLIIFAKTKEEAEAFIKLIFYLAKNSLTITKAK